MTKFRDLAIGDTFDFINPDRVPNNSFFERCRKTAPRKYHGQTHEYRVGSIDIEVYHVIRKREHTS